MDKKTAKVIEKYSMPFVQLVIEKGEEDRIFSDLDQIKQVAEETGDVYKRQLSHNALLMILLVKWFPCETPPSFVTFIIV